jgi:ribosome-associated protein
LSEEPETTSKVEMSESERRTAEQRREKVLAIVGAGRERHGQSPVALEIGKLTSYADCLIVMSGNSDRQVAAIADGIVRCLKERGDRPLGVEGLQDANWVLIDANDVIVHIFDSETREHFNLENLWSDAPAIALPEEESAAGRETTGPNQAVPRHSP